MASLRSPPELAPNLPRAPNLGLKQKGLLSLDLRPTSGVTLGVTTTP
jgi:hypothetical protein